jgi:hypothetical protein
MDYNWVPGTIAGVFALLSVVVAAWLQSRRERAKAEADGRSPGAPTTQQVWERQDLQERILRDALFLLAEVVEQHQDPSALKLPQAPLRRLAEAEYLPPQLEHLLTPE